jgi:hypothetical protein
MSPTFRSILVATALLTACTTPVWEVQKGPVQPADWMRVARVGGAAVDREDDEAEWIDMLERAVRNHVTVIEADSAMSDYMDDEVFAREIDMMRRFGALARARNLKVVWYYPSLEVITANGETLPNSMFKDHPDWVQKGLDEANPGQFAPNVFYGSKAFWVDPGAESAWMCHLSPWRQLYLDRVKTIATTGIDGLWLDVPLFNDIVGRWACQHDLDRAKFKADTGMEMPRVQPGQITLDPTDPAFKAWVAWRHTEIDTFLKEVLSTAQAVNPDFNLVVETVTMDYNAALFEGLDGAFAGPLDHYWHVWEVDVLSDTNAMVNGFANDWDSLVAMYEFGRGADAGRAAWAFTYGYLPDDAEAVMMASVTAQVNPYELKSPEMTSTVGDDYRQRVFGWLRDNEDDLFRSQSAARVAILHSSASRDYIDSICTAAWDDGEACGVSLFDTWQRPDPNLAWWSDDPDDSVHNARYLGEYRGIVKALSKSHVPFDVLPARLLTGAQAGAYDVLVAPSLAALSDGEADVIRAFAQAGGTVVFTGATPATMDALGGARVRADLQNTATYTLGSPTVGDLGAGRLYWMPDVGRQVLRGEAGAAALLADFASVVNDRATPIVRTDAGPGIHLDAYRRGNRTIVHALNTAGATGQFSIVQQSFRLGIQVGAATVTRVVATSARDPAPRELPFTTADGWVDIDAAVDVHSLFIVEVAP